MNFDLARTRDLARALGDPQDAFPAVHIAGTNGKGSVAVMTAAALRKSGLRTGLYTSPHLESMRERFQIDGRSIPEADLRRLSARLERLVRSRAIVRPTQFEALTAIAFLWFAEKKVDIAVMEVGLGGRLDTTNILGHVAVSVITTIGLDHMAWLGNTIRKIAAEKAGILRPRTPAVTATQGAALEVIRRRATALRAPLEVVTAPYKGKIFLEGRHQGTNAAVAAAALRRLAALGFPVTERAIRAGIADARWPGRFERFTLGTGQNRITVVLDGAHNVPAAEALAATLRRGHLANAVFVFGALRDKDVRGLARTFAPLAKAVVTVTAPSNRAVPAATLARLPVWRKRARAASLDDALFEAVRWCGRRPVVVTGSLYVVGAVRRQLAAKRLSSRSRS